MVLRPFIYIFQEDVRVRPLRVHNRAAIFWKRMQESITM